MKTTYALKMGLLLGLLSALSVVGYILFNRELYFSFAFVCLAWSGLAGYIYQLQTRVLRIMERLVNGIRFADFSFSCTTGPNGSLSASFAQEMDEALRHFRERISAQEIKHQYYETLLGTVDAGILVLDSLGNVEWNNPAATELLLTAGLKHIDELAALHPDFPALLGLPLSGKISVIRICKGELISELAVTSTLFTTRGKERILISLKNIRSVLEENEMEAWQKLIRVLTHEIMNSIAPIISLSETLSERANQHIPNEKEFALMGQAMQTIHRRSKGLLNFVENYRKLTRIPSPILAPVAVLDLFADLKKLFPSPYISYTCIGTPPLLLLDRSLIEQVLINLLKNAQEACQAKPQPQLMLEAVWQPSSHIFLITIRDNGVGIVPEVLDKIFVPFFTTKPSGSGIGLSLCKQIMNLHNGSISVYSEIEKGSCFTLKFTAIATLPHIEIE